VNYAIKTASRENILQRWQIANVCFVKFILRVKQLTTCVLSFDCRVVEVVEVVNDRYVPVSLGQQMIDQVRANKAGASGN
jgi:hypothetical protein